MWTWTPAPNTPLPTGPLIPTLAVDVPAASQVAHDLTASQVAVEVLGKKDIGRHAQTGPGPHAVLGARAFAMYRGKPTRLHTNTN